MTKLVQTRIANRGDRCPHIGMDFRPGAARAFNRWSRSAVMKRSDLGNQTEMISRWCGPSRESHHDL